MVGTHSLMVHDSALMTNTGKRRIDRDLTHAIHLDLTSSSSSESINTSGSLNLPTVNHSAAGNSAQFVDQDVTTSTGASLVCTTDSSPTHDREVTHTADQILTGLQINRLDITHVEHVDDSVMQISGTGHRFLEGWIGDHSVEYLVDSGSSVTAVSNSFYQTLVRAGAPLVVLGPTARTLLNTTIILLGGVFHGPAGGVSGPRLDVATGTYAIIGTDVLGSVLTHTLDIKNGLLFTEGGASLQLWDSAISGSAFTVGHCLIPPYSEAVLHCSVRTTGGRQMQSSGSLEGLTLFAENTGLILGRTLVDPSRWKVPVLVSNFSQDTVVVAPFSEVGMIAQVSAIQSITEPLQRPQGDADSLPAHLCDLLDQTFRDLDTTQQRRLADVLLQYSDLFPTPWSTLTSHTDAVEHEIDTGDSSPIHCAPRRMSPQKMKKEEDCVTEMLTGGQIEPSDSPWSSPVVLVKKKDGGKKQCSPGFTYPRPDPCFPN